VISNKNKGYFIFLAPQAENTKSETNPNSQNLNDQNPEGSIFMGQSLF
jgi:hypothetical protein